MSEQEDKVKKIFQNLEQKKVARLRDMRERQRYSLRKSNIHESRQIESGQTRDGKSEHQRFRKSVN